jgi:hypothetical protein
LKYIIKKLISDVDVITFSSIFGFGKECGQHESEERKSEEHVTEEDGIANGYSITNSGYTQCSC